MKQTLQILFLGLLSLSILLFIILKGMLEPGDGINSRLFFFNNIITGVWLILIVLHAILTGKASGHISFYLQKLRYLLNRFWFLGISISILSVYSILFIYNITYFSYVDFKSEQNVILYKENNKKIATVEAGKLNLIRLKIGERCLCYKSIDSEDIGSILPFKVKPFWKKNETITIKTIKQYEKIYN